MSELTTYQRLLREGLERKVYPGCALAIGRGDTVLFQETLGHVSYEPDAPAITADTLFDMASLSKIYGTTFCAFHMLEEGSLCLMDTVADFFPEAPEDKKSINVFQLMTHTSGIPAEIFLWKYCKSPDEAVDLILNTPLAYPTGTNVQYSCMGFILLGKIMEKITGKPLNELAQEWTFGPLGMTRTGYRPVSTSAPDLTAAYTETESLNGPCPPGIVHDENARFLNGISGNAGVFSTLNDSIRFAAMMARGGSPLISSRLMELASRNYTPGLDENRGLGFQLSGPAPTFFGDLFGNSGIGHTGFTGTSLGVDTETGLYVVLLTNRVHPTRNGPSLMRLRHQIYNAAMGAFLSK